jgi:GST-like protein
VNIAKGEQFKPAFLAISPNNRMPAIVDPDGPDGQPISVFESGAILRYLADKTGRFYGSDLRTRTAVDEWLFWQVGGLGPMAGQANHFRNYAPEQVPYGIKRYTDEVHRLFGVLDHRLSKAEFVAGAYSIADMASYPWTLGWKLFGVELDEFPHLKRWQEAIAARPAVVKAYAAGAELAAQSKSLKDDPDAQKVLFGQRAIKRD